MSAWSPEQDADLRHGYAEKLSIAEIAAAVGKTPAAVRNRAYRLGITDPVLWSVDELNTLEAWYRSRGGQWLELDKLAELLGRHKTNICRKARELSLTDQGRRSTPPRERMDPYVKHARLSAAAKLRIKQNGHPRGALGMKHTAETRERIAEASRRHNASLTPEQRQAIAERGTLTKIARYGTGNPAMANASNPYSRARGGRRADLGDTYFRSAWEANYARFLNFLVARGEIERWEYEPDRFVFHGITRGAITYSPDFKVYANDGGYEYHEVKGWMDSKSKSRLKRMAKFYPDEVVKVIGKAEYGHIATHFAGAIDGWE